MATETFFKDIYIDEEAADRIIAELEKTREPYVPEFNIMKELEEGREWLKNFYSKKSLKQEKNKNS